MCRCCAERVDLRARYRLRGGQPGSQQVILLEYLIHRSQAQYRCQHQRGKDNRRRPGDSGVDLGGLHAKHGLRSTTPTDSGKMAAAVVVTSPRRCGQRSIESTAQARPPSTTPINNNPSRRAANASLGRAIFGREPATRRPCGKFLPVERPSDAAILTFYPFCRCR